MIGHTVAALLLGGGLVSAASTRSTSKAGQKFAIPSWDLISSSDTSKDLSTLSKPGVDTSSWYHANVSKCTIMACLLNAGVYKDLDLFYSDNLNHVNWGQFSVPWLYRNEFSLTPAKGNRHYILETNGITSKADLFFNGKQIANSSFQAGAYGGHAYDITSLVNQKNALVVQAYPTQYLFDFAVGYVDWNPYPPDNGTGIWRDITVKEIGPVSLSAVNVIVDIDTPVERHPAVVTIRSKVQNFENSAVSVDVEAIITDPSGFASRPIKRTVKLGPHETKLIDLGQTIKSPKIWWPKQWGGQPLYQTEVTLTVGSDVSDRAKAKFGVRKVTSVVNSHNDTQYTLNGHPFQVIGGGYGADMFLRWDKEHFTRITDYMFDMHLNTIRLEGKFEHPELYELADSIGLMVMPGWECCDKWESWEYNHELALDPPPIWDARDYTIAKASIIHEVDMIQSHPSVFTFLVGSDFWPNDEATSIYASVMKDAGWQTPIIASASKRGYPELLGPSGMKMDGPYDWVPPNYWFDTNPFEDHLGAAFGFGSELGAGVGTPELGSLKKFLSTSDMDDLWKSPNKNLFHMSTNASSFYNRRIYNQALYQRFGAPTSLQDYLLKAQMMDYEATRSQYEGFAALWNADRPATGIIYWMLNNAWPSLHWNQFDYYLHPAGSYYGTKVGARTEHVAYDSNGKALWIINRSLTQRGSRTLAYELIGLDGKSLAKHTVKLSAKPNTSFKALDISKTVNSLRGMGLLRLVLSDGSGAVLSRNVYWLSGEIDVLDWSNSTWYYTQVGKFADYTALNKLSTAHVSAMVSPHHGSATTRTLVLENKSSVPAVFIRLNLVDGKGDDVNPVTWSDNYVTLWPHEKLSVDVGQWGTSGTAVQISGKNVQPTTVHL